MDRRELLMEESRIVARYNRDSGEVYRQRFQLRNRFYLKECRISNYDLRVLSEFRDYHHLTKLLRGDLTLKKKLEGLNQRGSAIAEQLKHDLAALLKQTGPADRKDRQRLRREINGYFDVPGLVVQLRVHHLPIPDELVQSGSSRMSPLTNRIYHFVNIQNAVVHQKNLLSLMASLRLICREQHCSINRLFPGLLRIIHRYGRTRTKNRLRRRWLNFRASRIVRKATIKIFQNVKS